MAKDTRTPTVVIRSCPTAWEQSGRLQGATDLPADEGCEAALVEELRRLFLGPERPAISAVYHAPDDASRWTAEAASTLTGARRRRCSAFAAGALGLWEGLTEHELADRHAKRFRQWQADPTAVTPPEGESSVSIEARLLNAAARIIERSAGKPVALVLRPLEFALLAAKLTDRPLGGVRELLSEGGRGVWCAASGEAVRRLASEPVKASA